MTDDTASPNPDLVDRFSALVRLAVEQSSAGAELRDAAKRVVDAAKRGAVTFVLEDGALRANGVAVDAPLLAARFAAYGVEELGVTPRASQADLLDLARLLAAPPGDGDPVARFTSRAAVIDSKALPRRLRARREPQAQPAAVVTAPPPPVQEPVPIEARDAPVRLAAPLAVPDTVNATLRDAIKLLQDADDPKRLTQALEQLVSFCDLAFRQGRQDDLIEGVAALIAIEFTQLERDASDAQRQAFNHQVRRLARPVVLRQLATLRHLRKADPVATERLQQSLYRFGVDGAEAMLDECASAPNAEALAACLESLRGLVRRHDALRTQSTHPNELIVRQAVAILGALRDDASEVALDGLLAHPDPRTRRDVVAALARFDTETAFASLVVALGDESAMVRVRAVTALHARREPRILRLLEPLLRTEPEREVLFAAVDAVGAVGTPEAVQLLIQIAQGQGSNPLRDSTGLRIQACIALVAIRSPQSMAAVQVLRDDRDREVRQASMRLVAHAKRRPTSTQTAIIAP